MSFFNTTPIGRIISRFASDIDILDDRLPRTYRVINNMLFNLLGIIVVISVKTPLFLAVIIPISLLLYVLIKVNTMYILYTSLCYFELVLSNLIVVYGQLVHHSGRKGNYSPKMGKITFLTCSLIKIQMLFQINWGKSSNRVRLGL